MDTNIEIKDSAEALAAIASILIAADSVGRVEERNAVIERLKTTGALAGQENAHIAALLGRVTGQLCERLPTTESGAFTPAAVGAVIEAVKPLLDRSARAEALDLAEATAHADSASPEEQAIVDRFRVAFAI